MLFCVPRESAGAAVAFQPFALETGEPRNASGGTLGEVVEDLGCTVLVLASEDIELDSQPEQGRHGEIAAIADAAEKAGRLARKAEETAARAAEAAAAARKELEEAGPDPERSATLERQLASLEQEAEKAARRAARARAKADLAEREAAKRLNGGAESQ